MFLPEERLDLPTAHRTRSRWDRAYVNHLEADTGSIEVGKLADLVVLDRNLFERPGTDISAGRVLLTLVEGRTVHAEPELA